MDTIEDEIDQIRLKITEEMKGMYDTSGTR